MTGSNGNGKQTNWKRKRVSLQTGQSQSISRTKTSQSSKTETNLSNPNTTQPTTTETNSSHPNSSQPTMSQQNVSHKCLCGKICKSAAGLKSHKRSSKCPNNSYNLNGGTEHTVVFNDLIIPTTNTSRNTKTCMSQPLPPNIDPELQNSPKFSSQPSSINICGDKRCVNCPRLKISSIFNGTNSKLQYTTINHDAHTLILNCGSTNLIYL